LQGLITVRLLLFYFLEVILDKIDVHTLAYSPVLSCYNIAQQSYFYAKKLGDSSSKRYHLIIGYCFVAFTLEAMLNHLHFVFCDCDVSTAACSLEGLNKGLKFQRYNSEVRHKTLFKKIGLPKYRGSKTFNILAKIIKYRDSVVHGKTVRSIKHTVELARNSTPDSKLFAVSNAPIGIEKDVSLSGLNEALLALVKMQSDIIGALGELEDDGHSRIKFGMPLSNSPISIF